MNNRVRGSLVTKFTWIPMDRRTLLFSFIFAFTFFAINSYFFPPQKIEQSVTTQVQEAPKAIHQNVQVANDVKETFYVLENEYQQVVFSNMGGAIAEVNLPLSQKETPSIIKEISLDNLIKDRSPQNAMFPLHVSVGIDENGAQVVKTPEFGGYTPLLRRSLKNDAGKEIFTLPHRHYALNLVNLNEPSASYEMTRMTANEIDFTAKLQGRTIVKTFRLNQNAPYSLELDVAIDGDTSNLWLTSGLLEVELISGSYSPVLKYCNGSKMKKLKLPKADATFDNIKTAWASNSNGFFGIITSAASSVLKVDNIHGTKVPTRLSLIDPINDLYSNKNFPAYEILVPYSSGSAKETFRIYAGPFDDGVLQKVDAAYTDSHEGKSSNFSLATRIQGWFSAITEPFAKFLSFFLNFFYSVTHSWGFSIILLTLTLRLMLFPLNNWSYKSNLKMQKIQPKLKALQEKYKKDPKRLQMEMMLLYKNEKVNPLSAFLPFIIQLPFLFGMFDLLKSSFALRGASFIPGWIDNLTAPDVLFSWDTPVWFFGTSFHLLPFITGALMFVQQRLSSALQQTTTPLTEQQQQMRMMGYIMTPIFILIFYSMPSGLNIYWIFSTIFGILQEFFIRRKNNTTGGKATLRK